MAQRQQQQFKPERADELMSQPLHNRVYMGYHFSTIYCSLIMAAFPLPFFILLTRFSSEPAALVVDGHEMPWWSFVLTQTAFGTGLLLDFVTYLWTVDKTKSRLFIFPAVINGLAFCSYSSLANGYAPIFTDFNGRRLFPVRYLQWTFSTPTMLFFYSIMSSIPTYDVVRAMVLDVIMVITGYLASYVETPYNFIWLLLSFGCFHFVIQAIHNMLCLAIEDCSPEDNEYRDALKYARMFMVGNWCAIPLVWCVAALDLITVTNEEICYEILDFASKCGISCMLLHSSMQTRSEKLSEIQEAILKKEREDTIRTLEDAASQRDKFFAAISHEFRTPLNGIVGLAEGLMLGNCGEVTSKMRERLNTIKLSGLRLANMVNDILDTSSAKVHALRVVEGSVDLVDVCNHVIEMTQPLVRKGIRLSLDLPRDVPMIRADQAILHNILGNAAKFTTEGSIELSVKIDRQDNFVYFTVTDTGPGIPPDKLESVFKPYNTGDEAISKKFGGTGLGMSIVDELVRAHGGSVRLESTLGQGSKFIVAIPLIVIDASSSSMSQDMPVSPISLGHGDLSDKNSAMIQQEHDDDDMMDDDGGLRSYSDLHGGVVEVFSVDDDPVNQMVIEGLLVPQGFVVTPAMDGEEALQMLAGRDYLPDVVLLDCQMPKKTGFEVCEELRRSYPKSLPVIMISANTDEENILKGFQVGSNDYVKKPFNRAEVLARIRTQLKLRDIWKTEVDAAKSSRLLSKMLPTHIMARLKEGQNMIADSHDQVTILFSDIVGFTNLAASITTADLILVLNEMFTAFDNLVDKHGVYKVETIGDAYMVAAGHEESSKDNHHIRVFAMAQDMIDAVSKVHLPDGSTNLKIRIGIHSGPAYAGVVGVKCPRYCFFGDTVNTSSRMESNGFPMCIHVSSVTAELLKDECDWIEYGSRTIKGKGLMTTYIAKLGEWEAAIRDRDEKEQAAQEAAASSPGLTNSMGALDPLTGLISTDLAMMRIQAAELDEREAVVQEMEQQLLYKQSVVEQGVQVLAERKEKLEQEMRDFETSKSATRNVIESSKRRNSQQNERQDEGLKLLQARKEIEGLQQQLAQAMEQLGKQEATLSVERAELDAAKSELRQAHARSISSSPNRYSGYGADNSGDGGWQAGGRSNEGARDEGSSEANGNMQSMQSPQKAEMCKWLIDVLAGNVYPGQANEVEMLLRHLGLSHYASLLEREEIHTLLMLAQMDSQSLDEIGIKTKAARSKMLDGARGMRALIDGSRYVESVSMSRSQGSRVSSPYPPLTSSRGGMTNDAACFGAAGGDGLRCRTTPSGRYGEEGWDAGARGGGGTPLSRRDHFDERE